MLANGTKARFDFSIFTSRLLEVVAIELASTIDDDVLGLSILLFDGGVQCCGNLPGRGPNLEHSESHTASGEMAIRSTGEYCGRRCGGMRFIREPRILSSSRSMATSDSSLWIFASCVLPFSIRNSRPVSIAIRTIPLTLSTVCRTVCDQFFGNFRELSSSSVTCSNSWFIIPPKIAIVGNRFCARAELSDKMTGERLRGRLKWWYQRTPSPSSEWWAPERASGSRWATTAHGHPQPLTPDEAAQQRTRSILRQTQWRIVDLVEEVNAIQRRSHAWRAFGSDKQICDSLGFDQFSGLVQVVVNHGLGIDAERVVNSCQHFNWMHGVFQRRGRGLV
jgi:hypothetical protein